MITSRHEEPVVFEAGGEMLAGVLTRPTGNGNGLAVITLYGTGPFPVFGRNRVGVSVARDLAELGFHVLRFDYRGAGESGGAPREPDLNAPWVDDVLGAVRHLGSLGCDEIALVGVCFGARNALASADQIPGLVGMLVISPPVGQTNHTEAILQKELGWYVRRAASLRSLRGLVQGTKAKRRRALLRARLGRMLRLAGSGSQGASVDGRRLPFFEQVSAIVERRVALRIVYGRKDDFFSEFERAMAGPLGELLTPQAGVTVKILDGHGSNVASLDAQRAMRSEIEEWARTLSPATVPEHS